MDAREEFKQCEQCGKRFSRFDVGVMPKQWASRRFCSRECDCVRRGYGKSPGPEVLRDLYEVRKMTPAQISRSYGVARPTVVNWLKTSGIQLDPTRIGVQARGVVPPTVEELRNLVHGEHLPYEEIAKRYDVDLTTIPYWLKKHGIPRPTAWDTRSKGNRPPLPDAETLGELYASGLSTREIALDCGLSQRTIGKACKQFGIDLRRPGFGSMQDYACQDGQKVRSSLERRVADWLIARSLAYEYEPSVPYHGSWKSDFLVNGWYVEIWGVRGWKSYDSKRASKVAWYAECQLPLIEILPEDFSSPSDLDARLGSCLEPATYSLEEPRPFRVISGRKVTKSGSLMLACLNCGKDFEPCRGQIYAGRTQKYCGVRCKNLGRSKLIPSPEEKFRARIEIGLPSECWRWKGSTIDGGYATFRVDKRHVFATKFSWELANGPIPEGHRIVATCNNKSCCNPAHLNCIRVARQLTGLNRSGHADRLISSAGPGDQ